MARILRPRAVAQSDFDGLVRIDLRGQRHQRFTAVGAGVHRLAVDLGFPQLGSRWQGRPQRAAAFGFYEKPGIGHPLAIARDLAGELEEIDDLLDRFARLEPLDLHPDLEIAGGVLPRC